MQHTGGSSARLRSENLVLGSTFVPNYAPCVVAPACSESANMELRRSFRVFMAEMSDQIVQHLAPITNQVRANHIAMEKLQDSISRLSKQVEESKPTCFESLPVLRHWNSALDSLASHLKAAEVNQRLSMANLDRLNEAAPTQCVRGTCHEPDVTAAPKHGLSMSANKAVLEDQLRETSSRLHHAESHPPKYSAPPETSKASLMWKPETAKAKSPSTESNDGNRPLSDIPYPSGDSISQEDLYHSPESAVSFSKKRCETWKRASMAGVIRDQLEAKEAKTSASRFNRCYFYIMGRLLEWWLCFEEEPPKREGPFAKLVDSFRFELVSALCVIINIVTLTVFVDYQMKHFGDPRCYHLDWAFVSVYCAELAMRLSVHRWYFFIGPGCGWNNFDAVLLAVSLHSNITSTFLHSGGPVGGYFVQPLRILRIFRIFRLMKFMRFASGWDKIFKVLIGSLVHVLGSFLMLAFVFYVVGLIIVQDLGTSMLLRDDAVLQEEVRSIFGSVRNGMFTLFRSVFNGDDWNNHFQIIEKASPLASALFVFFVGFVQISLFNIVSATYILHAQTLLKKDHQTKAMEQILKQRTQAAQLRNLFERIMDQDGSKTISPKEFQKSLESDHTRAEFMLCGLDIQNAEDFFQLMQKLSNDHEVEIEKFVAACMMMKGGASAIEQNKMLMEARDFQHRVAEHFFRIKHWQSDVIRKLDAMGTSIS